jgi:hypothetical protein
MSGDIHVGDSIHQSGPGSIGKIQHQGSSDSAAALLEMVRLAVQLRTQAGDVDRDAIDASVEVARDSEHAERSALRQAVGSLITIAAKAGQAGTPLLDVALKVKTLFGL